jgi:hypothetical protein
MNNNDVLRATRGPVTLITIGLLFALDHLTRFSFWQTWPVLLIVFGLLSLASRSGRPAQSSVETPGTSVGGGIQ